MRGISHAAAVPALLLAGCLVEFPGFGGGADGAPAGDAARDADRPTDGRAPDARGPDAARVDAAPADARLPDAHPDVDATPVDARARDARPDDAAPTDGRVTDARPVDSAPTDAQAPDARPVDARAGDALADARPDDAAGSDARLGDAAPLDAARPEVGPPDAVVDAAAPDAVALDAAVDASCGDARELCNGRDDDCDGRPDEGDTCGRYVETHCRVWLAWADVYGGPAQAAGAWGDCPAAEADMGGDVRCTSTRGDGRFRVLDLEGDVNFDDRLAVGFTCNDFDRPELAAWIQFHCAVFLGHADWNWGPDNADAWGPCPGARNGDDGRLRCTSSGYDGQFRGMQLTGNVDGNDDFGVAFRCRDDLEAQRAAIVQESVEVYVAWSENTHAWDGNGQWGDCPGARRDDDGSERCVSSAGDGRFHQVGVQGNVDGGDMLGIGLMSR